ncbi:bifunctional 3'-5' exonuclease/DNA polymerase [Glaciihabitans arcticus]|uniref:DNA-directed DNA polymerase n=1 Tax=Glaciihabitans arcticus TaxID=2668039 RepID=A0A4Q9GPW7_9MICO|nr:bifunctional 3'-5' exonuclease/DNA polymerase [Glaciihabitans arcticus]TBN56902.1 bifunctional 3'-5' exonuclease/DNA polymerase [Glaciihabitans arcticus]
MFVVLARTPDGIVAHRLDGEARPSDEPELIEPDDFAEWAELENEGLEGEAQPRWVWDDTRRWYPQLLAAGVRVERCIDLRLSHNILKGSTLTAASELATTRSPWDSTPPLDPSAPTGEERKAKRAADSLFDEDLFELGDEREEAPDPVAEFLLQRRAVASSAEPNRINLLLAAESAGALIGVEMKHGGLPWHEDIHRAMLTEVLGPRPRGGDRPARLEQLHAEMQAHLDGAEINPDSPADLLKALRRAGIMVESTRSWDLEQIEHPVIEPLLRYKKLSRLMTANGWTWLETWVADGRFRPDYVPGGAATGRWGASGGGALQLPKQVRAAVVADPGWKLIVADASQLEPRILSALSADRAMAAAGSGDLYNGIVASGAVATRAEAKIAMLGAMYGATTGESGRLMPKLAKAFPQAIAMVEAAARTGERGELVSTRLGRSSMFPGESWREIQGAAQGDGATAADQNRARSQSRAWGRFTRNFIVQGTAAEWALCWMAGLRKRLWAMTDGTLTEGPHLVFFLHDEVIVHAPAELADHVLEEVRAAAADAGRLIFGNIPVQFPVTAVAVDDYSQAK